MAVPAAGNARLALEEPGDGRSEAGIAPGEGGSAGDSLWSSREAGMTTGVYPDGTGLAAESAAGSRDQKLGGAGRSWEAWLGSFLGVPVQTWL